MRTLISQEGAETEERPGVPAGHQPEAGGGEGQAGRGGESARVQTVPRLLPDGEVRPGGRRLWRRSRLQLSQASLGSSIPGDKT